MLRVWCRLGYGRCVSNRLLSVCPGRILIRRTLCRRSFLRGGLLGGSLLGRCLLDRGLLGRCLLRCGLLGRSLLRRSLLRRSLLGCGLLGWGLLGRRLLGRCHPFLLWLVWYGIVGRLGLGGLSHRDWDDTWDGQVDTAAWGVERMDHELVAHAGAQHLARASGGGVAEVVEGQVAACALGEDVGPVRGAPLDLPLAGPDHHVAA